MDALASRHREKKILFFFRESKICHVFCGELDSAGTKSV